MSCNECDKIESLNKKGKQLAYTRVGQANVLVCACDKHFRELQRERGIEFSDDRIIYRV